ncbi:MAG: hypothetical protein J6B16_03320 [Clostridia bacterium]|nr:hypothetical protein [Clostridia bacterium]
MKKLITILIAIMMCFSVIACTNNNNNGGGNGGAGDSNYVQLIKNQTYYDQVGVIDSLTGVELQSNYTKNLFYRNNVPFTCADPFAFQCTDVTDEVNYGKFFLYGTASVGVFNCFESTDLVSWERKFGAYQWQNEGWEKSDCWAPEVAYDKDADPADYGLEDDGIGQGVYFFYYSASSWVDYMPDNQRVLGLAVGTSPYGPFTMYNGEELGAKIGGIDYGTEDGYSNLQAAFDSDTAKGRVGDVISMDDPWFNDSAARASLSFQFENKDKAGSWVDPDGNVVDENTPDATYIPENAAYMEVDEGAGWITCIDPHPYVDPIDGQKYLYFSLSGGSRSGYDQYGLPYWQGQQVYAVKMLDNDWTQIDYSSMVRCTRGTINVISDAAAEAYQDDADNFDASLYPLGHQEGDLGLVVERAEAECRMSQAGVNEGPFVLYNEDTGLYYMTISVAGYTDSSYSLVQLTAYRPTGPWRKLDLDEGAVVLSTDVGKAMDNVFGPGHHSFIQVGDELINVYHKHINYAQSVHNRGPAVDRVQWVKNNQGMTVLHTNGPSTAVQPLIYGTGATEYDNIADEATITTTASTERYLDALNDGVVRIHNEDVAAHLHEYEFEDATNVITLKFDSYKAITGLMIYNSRLTDSSFLNIAKIEMDAKMNGKEFTAYIENLEMYWDKYTFANAYDILPGSSAVAVFDELAIKEIRITVNNINDAEAGYSGYTAISDIVVLGKPDYTPNVTGDNSGNVTIKNYNNVKQEVRGVYDGYTIDGILSDDEWGHLNSYETTLKVGGVDHDITTSMAFTSKGLVVYWSVLGAPAFVNPDRDMHNNSGMEIYLAPGDAVTTLNKAWQIELFYDGTYGSTKWIQFGNGSHDGYASCNSFIDCYGQVDGIPNDASNNGYVLEAYIPWEIFGLTEAPESMMMDGAVLYCPTYNGKREAWVSLSSNLRPTYQWNNPQSWYRFDSDGWVDDINFDGHWVYTGYESGFIVGEDGLTVEVFNPEDPWNYAAPVNIQAVGQFGNPVYHQANFFAPSIYNSDLAVYENNPNEETCLNGLWTSQGTKVSVETQYNQGNWYLRFAGPWWNNAQLSEAQVALYKDANKGLPIGLYVDGNTAIAYADDGTGTMIKMITIDVSSKVTGFDTSLPFKVGIHAQCDSIIKNHVIFGAATTVPYIVNNGEALVGGSVTVTGNMTASTITVTPDAGYALDKLIVNGQEVNSLVCNASSPVLNIIVTFKEVAGDTVTITLNGGFGYEEAKPLVGVAVSLIDGTDNYYGVVGADGKVTLTIPEGEYTLTAQGYASATIVIDGEDAYSATLIRNVFGRLDYGNLIPETAFFHDNGSINGAIVYYDGSQAALGDPAGEADEARFYINEHVDFSGPVVLTYTLNIQLNVRAFAPVEFNSKFMCNFGVWDNESLIYKKYNANPAINMSVPKNTLSGKTYAVVDFIVIVEGANATILYKDVNGAIVYIDTFSQNEKITSINFRTANHGGYIGFERVKVYDGEGALALIDSYGASITVENNDNATVTAQNKIKFNETADIVITPAENYKISAVKINGQDVTFSANIDGTVELELTHSNMDIDEYVIEVSAILSVMTTATFNVSSAKAYTTPAPIADGTVVTVKGTMGTYTQAVVDGKISFTEIASGDYQLSINGYVSATVTIDSDGFDGDVTLMYNPFVESSHMDVSGIGSGTVKFLNKSTDAVNLKDEDIKFFSARIVDKIDLNSHALEATSDIGGTKIWFINGNGEKANWETQYLGPNAQYGGNGSSPHYRVRFQNSWEYYNISTTLQDNLVNPDKGLTLAVACKNGKVYGFIKDEADNWVLCVDFDKYTGDFRILGVCSEFGASTLHDVYYSTTIPAEVDALIV